MSVRTKSDLLSLGFSIGKAGNRLGPSQLMRQFSELGEETDGLQALSRFAAFNKGYRIGRRSFIAAVVAEGTTR